MTIAHGDVSEPTSSAATVEVEGAGATTVTTTVTTRAPNTYHKLCFGENFSKGDTKTCRWGQFWYFSGETYKCILSDVQDTSYPGRYCARLRRKTFETQDACSNYCESRFSKSN